MLAVQESIRSGPEQQSTVSLDISDWRDPDIFERMLSTTVSYADDANGVCSQSLRSRTAVQP